MLRSFRFSFSLLILPLVMVGLLAVLVAACDNPPATPTGALTPANSGEPPTATRANPYPGFTVLPNGGTPWPSVTPGSVEDHVNRGNDAFQRDQFDEAIAQYTQA